MSKHEAPVSTRTRARCYPAGEHMKVKAAPTPHVHGPDCAHGAQPEAPVRRSEPKVGRNDPCPCGSGRKHKKCHGAASAEPTVPPRE
jgi:hypothetical protein